MNAQEPSGVYLPSTTVGETIHAFVPHPLPPTPPLGLPSSAHDLYEKANRALGRLDGISLLLPDTTLFIYMYVRKEAVLSSQIEGTQSSLSDLLLFELDEAPGVPINDVVEVSNYVAALNHGLRRLREDKFPLSGRLLREVHAVLLRSGRGKEKQPGEFRTTQNWIGGTRPGNARYVPPPHKHVPELMGNLEKFLHDDYGRTPSILKAAIAHVQFETIHPFLDGNGRIGRLLVTLLLCEERVLAEPTLYLSLYFKEHREQYYALLQKVREESAWEEWTEFFLTGVYETAQRAFNAAQSVVRMFETDRSRIEQLGRLAGSALQLHAYLQRRVLLSVPEAESELSLTRPTIYKAVSVLEKLGILRELTGKDRNRVWAYQEYLSILSDGAESEPS